MRIESETFIHVHYALKVMRTAVPRLHVEDLYKISLNPNLIKQNKKYKKSSLDFLNFLGITSFKGSKEEFMEVLREKFIEKFGSVIEELSMKKSINPISISKKLDISKTSAKNLLRIMRELGLLRRVRIAVDTIDDEDALMMILSSKGEATIEYLERVIPEARRLVLKAWREGRVDIVGNPRGLLPGEINLPRDLPDKIPERIIKDRKLINHPRLDKFIERETGELYYYIVLRGDDRVRFVA